MNKLMLVLCVCAGVLGGATMPALCGGAGGNHWGERNNLLVDIQFTNSFGTTTVNGSGVVYSFFGRSIPENKIYAPQYWGDFPLYFFNTPTSVQVRIKHLGQRPKMKLKIVTEAYVLKTDGSNGAIMTPRTVREIMLVNNELQVIDASFITPYTPDAESGLDRFIVKVLHVNEGGGPGNEEPALIMSREGIYCPPLYMPGQ